MEKLIEEKDYTTTEIINHVAQSKLINYVRQNDHCPIFQHMYEIDQIEDVVIYKYPLYINEYAVYDNIQFAQTVSFDIKHEIANKTHIFVRCFETLISSLGNSIDEHIIRGLQKSARTVSKEDLSKTKFHFNNTIISPNLINKGGIEVRSVSWNLEDGQFITLGDHPDFYLYDDGIHIVRELDVVNMVGHLNIGFNLNGYQLYTITK